MKPKAKSVAAKSTKSVSPPDLESEPMLGLDPPARSSVLSTKRKSDHDKDGNSSRALKITQSISKKKRVKKMTNSGDVSATITTPVDQAITINPKNKKNKRGKKPEIAVDPTKNASPQTAPGSKRQKKKQGMQLFNDAEHSDSDIDDLDRDEEVELNSGVDSGDEANDDYGASSSGSGDDDEEVSSELLVLS